MTESAVSPRPSLKSRILLRYQPLAPQRRPVVHSLRILLPVLFPRLALLCILRPPPTDPGREGIPIGLPLAQVLLMEPMSLPAEPSGSPASGAAAQTRAQINIVGAHITSTVAAAPSKNESPQSPRISAHSSGNQKPITSTWQPLSSTRLAACLTFSNSFHSRLAGTGDGKF